MPLATITGTVKRNLGRGTKLGYPTANIDYNGDLADGVYIAHTTISDTTVHPSLAFIGASETFNATDRKMEVYILDFNSDIYDQQISVELIKHTRPNKKFDSIESLLEQMRQDEVEARKYFKL